VESQFHRDQAELHKAYAEQHELRQEDFERLRQKLSEASDATVLDCGGKDNSGLSRRVELADN
jgi:hypothetical protein